MAYLSSLKGENVFFFNEKKNSVTTKWSELQTTVMPKSHFGQICLAVNCELLIHV